MNEVMCCCSASVVVHHYYLGRACTSLTGRIVLESTQRASERHSPSPFIFSVPLINSQSLLVRGAAKNYNSDCKAEPISSETCQKYSCFHHSWSQFSSFGEICLSLLLPGESFIEFHSNSLK
ncbi:hypothetical protein XENOCAPTIV_018395 [Xenoophorus captivus]|uniref:Uncharacterized protein n=1 Tax=Xenoophorus captivus TaxID=1517983 RepID=A0ABV0SIU4_9TELE